MFRLIEVPEGAARVRVRLQATALDLGHAHRDRRRVRMAHRTRTLAAPDAILRHPERTKRSMSKTESPAEIPAKGPLEASDFIREVVAQDLRDGKHGGRVVTRFPPEPNGYPHIGHAFAMGVSFNIADEVEGGVYHLRFDDTNPEAEEEEFVEAIQEDIRWLGYDWGDKLFFASDYFEKLYDYAVDLIRKGLAFVDSCTGDEIREMRGDFYRPGTNSPHRDRSVDENLDLFRRMRAGEFEDGAHVLRAKIDMQSPDLNLRDPLMYRIKHSHHHRTGDEWSIYPMYDWAHGLSDSIEGITHSLCSMEFADHRPLYDWFLEACQTKCRPQQIEFARLNLTYTVLSKRRLLESHGRGRPRAAAGTTRGCRR